MTYSLHTYDVGMFGNIYVPNNPLATIGLSHWLISLALQNLVAEEDAKKSLCTEIGHAMDHYLYKHYDVMSEELIQYIREMCICYYVTVENYFAQFKPIEHVDTPEKNRGVAIVFKD